MSLSKCLTFSRVDLTNCTDHPVISGLTMFDSENDCPQGKTFEHWDGLYGTEDELSSNVNRPGVSQSYLSLPENSSDDIGPSREPTFSGDELENLNVDWNNHRSYRIGNLVVKLPTKVHCDKKAEFICKHCSAKFKVKGYLKRHIKKHDIDEALHCPYYDSEPASYKKSECHTSGLFSRRDTFVAHLKAIHFLYPPGTRAQERQSQKGHCAGCFEAFPNNEYWLKEHVELGRCKAANYRALAE